MTEREQNMAEYIVFIDESGDDNIARVDPNYPIFVLGAVIMEKTYHNTEAIQKVARFKSDFMTPGQILHTVDILRNQKGYEFLKDSNTRQLFYSGLNALIADLEFTLITAILDIPKAIAKWGLQQRTPYVYLIQLLLERIYLCLRSQGTAKVFAESRQPHLDALIHAEFQRVCSGATMITPSTLLQRMFPG